MINRLRKRIYWIIQLSLTIIIIGIIAIFIGFSYRNLIESSTMYMDRIDAKRDVGEEKHFESNEPILDNDPFLISVEGVYKLEISNDDIIKETNNVTDEVRGYANKISSNNKKEGFVGNLIYKIRIIGNNGKEITLIENEDAINRFKNIVVFSIALGLVSIFVTNIIARKISKTIVKPVEDSFEKQKQFISDASHELKTPLAVIEANADVLQSKVGENKWINYIQNEIQSMNKLVNDLLTLSKMENRNSINMQKFDLSKEIQMSVAVFESMIYEKEIRLETNVTDNIIFNGQKEDIKHIISIILDNALKHTNKGGKIIVDVEKNKNEIIIEIKNQGEPIPDNEKEKIFERFYRIDKARSRNEKRYGLRTFNCKRNCR